MDEGLLVEKYRTLYHMAEPSTWPSMQQHGLLSTGAMLDLTGATSEERISILNTHRKAQVNHRGFLIRDQKPMNHNLASCLPATITQQQWFEFLNRRVFFWTKSDRLQKFRSAYGNKRQLLLEIPTSRMVEAHREDVRLCHINSGATRMPNHFGASTPSLPSPVFLTPRKELRRSSPSNTRSRMCAISYPMSMRLAAARIN